MTIIMLVYAAIEVTSGIALIADPSFYEAWHRGFATSVGTANSRKGANDREFRLDCERHIISMKWIAARLGSDSEENLSSGEALGATTFLAWRSKLYRPQIQQNGESRKTVS